MSEDKGFLSVLGFSLIMDLILLVALPFSGEAIYLLFAILLFASPLLVSGCASNAVTWMSNQSASGSTWSGLARTMCGSSLLFLLVTTTMFTCGDPIDSHPISVLSHIYILVLFTRLYAANIVNVLVSIVTLIMGKGAVDRASSVSALLCSAAALAMFQFVQDSEVLKLLSFDADTLKQYLVFLGLFSLSYSYSLVWGATVHAVLRKLKY